MIRTYVVLLALSMVILACVAETPGTGWTGTVDTLASGIVEVRNPSMGRWGPDDAWLVEEVSRIGSVHDDGPSLFGQIVAIELDDHGRVWIHDGQANEIRVFDSLGNHVRTVGRDGDGPGEFRSVSGMAWGPQGHLWTVDPSAGRVSVFDTTGAFLRSFRIDGSFHRFPWAGTVDHRGRYLDAGIDRVTREEVLVRYDTLGIPVDTFALPVYPGRPNVFEHSEEGSRTRTPIPFAGQLRWRLDGDEGVWALFTGEYRMVHLTLAGDTLRSVYRLFDPRPVSGEELDSAVAQLRWFPGRVDRGRIPHTHPPVILLTTDELGYLWVIRNEGTRDTWGRLWDVFDPEGVYMGEVRLPFTLYIGVPPVIQESVIAGAIRDDLGVFYVVRARMDGRGAGK